MSVTFASLQTADLAAQSSQIATSLTYRIPTVAESVLGKTLGAVFGAATVAKLGYDSAFYIGGLFGCVK